MTLLEAERFYATLAKFNVKPNDLLTAAEILAILEVDAGKILFGKGPDSARLSNFKPHLEDATHYIYKGQKLRSHSDRVNRKKYYFFTNQTWVEEFTQA